MSKNYYKIQPKNKNKDRYTYHSDKKYKSVIFLSKRFQMQTEVRKQIQQNNKMQQNINKSQTFKNKAQTNKIGDLTVSQKIQMLLKPVYPVKKNKQNKRQQIMTVRKNYRVNNQKLNLKVINSFRFALKKHKTEINESILQPKNYQSENYIYSSPLKLKTKTQPEITIEKEQDKNQKNQQNQICYSQNLQSHISKIKTERTVNTQRYKNIETNQLKQKDKDKDKQNQKDKQLTQNISKQETKKKKQSDKMAETRWISKSNIQKLHDQYEDVDIQKLLQNRKKKITNKTIILPKSSLYMNVYLRIRDKQQENSHQIQQENKPNIQLNINNLQKQSSRKRVKSEYKPPYCHSSSYKKIKQEKKITISQLDIRQNQVHPRNKNSFSKRYANINLLHKNYDRIIKKDSYKLNFDLREQAIAIDPW